VLYPKINLTPRVFTAFAKRMLKLIASQAAISLENARLYTDLRPKRGLFRPGLRRTSVIAAVFWLGDFPAENLFVGRNLRIFASSGETTTSTLELLRQRIHPGDDASLPQVVSSAASRDAQDFLTSIRCGCRMEDPASGMCGSCGAR